MWSCGQVKRHNSTLVDTELALRLQQIEEAIESVNLRVTKPGQGQPPKIFWDLPCRLDDLNKTSV